MPARLGDAPRFGSGMRTSCGSHSIPVPSSVQRGKRGWAMLGGCCAVWLFRCILLSSVPNDPAMKCPACKKETSYAVRCIHCGRAHRQADRLNAFLNLGLTLAVFVLSLVSACYWLAD